MCKKDFLIVFRLLYLLNILWQRSDTVGTLSMLPREKNGVVDGSLRVYGTKNIRVVDLSVVPLQISAHTQGTFYLSITSFIRVPA